MMSGYGVAFESFRQMVGDLLGETASVHKDERSVVLADQVGESVIDFFPHFVACHSPQLVTGNLHSQFHMTLVSHVEDHRRAINPGQEPGNGFNRFLGCRKSNSLEG